MYREIAAWCAATYLTEHKSTPPWNRATPLIKSPLHSMPGSTWGFPERLITTQLSVVQKNKELHHHRHQHKAVKPESLDNRVLRAFERVIGAKCKIKDGQAALNQLRSSAQIRLVSHF